MSAGGDAGLEFRDLRAKKDPELLRALHGDLFRRFFPDPDEQEGPDDWAPRLWGDAAAQNPEQHGFVAGTDLDDPAARRLDGFAFVERYRDSRCGLLSYIAVADRCRGQGLGRTLFDLAVASARAAAERDGAPLRAVFAEIHDPRRVRASDDVIDPHRRLAIMVRLGARLVPVEYVQPALGPAGNPSDRLMLLVFPNEAEDELDSEVVRGFLREYYASLDAAPDDAGIARMLSELDTPTVDLHLREEEPCLTLTTFGIALHFVYDAHAELPPMLDVDGRSNFESFEKDLFSYTYAGGSQPAPATPFASRVVNCEPKTVSLTMPAFLVYDSEGERVLLHVKRQEPPYERRRELAVRASRTDFVNGISVLHLVLVGTGEPDSVLDEYDVVALSKLWQGGENWSALDNIRFDWADRVAGGGTSAVALAEAIFGHDLQNDNVRCGTIEILTEEQLCANWDETLQLVSALRDETAGADDKHPAHEAMCGVAGMVQGLLDLRAVDLDEVGDVFAPLEIDERRILGIHKGTVIFIAEKDRVFTSVCDAIGVSPYLLLPQAVLIYNEQLLEKAEKARSLGQYSSTTPQAIRVMRGALADYLPNVFHYPQERRLLQHGEASRGFRGRRVRVLAQAVELETRQNQRVTDRRSLADDLRNGLLLALTAVTVLPQIHGARSRALTLAGFIILGLILLLYPRPWAAQRWFNRSTDEQNALKELARMLPEKRQRQLWRSPR
jgi:GNAT superfamily N-acetyltransferase